MNVFILDRSMNKSAQILDDAHLKAQINEACQILMANWSNKHFPDAKIGHLHHPITKYYSMENTTCELLAYLYFLTTEYYFRFRKEHQNYFWAVGFETENTKFKSVFDTFYASKTYVNGRMTDNIEEIRNYIMTKPHNKPYTWTNREKPDWWVIQ